LTQHKPPSIRATKQGIEIFWTWFVNSDGEVAGLF
jgi:hypothetical protein